MPDQESRKRLLLIEDSPEQAVMMMNWLETSGQYAVVHAPDGTSGAQFARYGEWDLVVSDIELPGMLGIELVRHFKARNPDTPFLLITAHKSADYAIEALRNRADDFLVKPLDAAVFLDKIATLIAVAEAKRQAEREVVLAIGAHPDDVEIGIGGTLLRHRARGDEVIILTMSGGEQGGLTQERQRESQSAADYLGATLVMGALQDTAISEGLETIDLIEKTLQKHQPTTVYTHTPRDGHQDHRNVHRATIVACRNVPNVYCYQAPSTSVEFQPNLFIDITPFIDGKLELIAAYRSQVLVRAYLEDDLTRATARYWGRFAGYSLVEPLEVIRQRG